MPFDHAAAQEARAKSARGKGRALSVFDTGEQLQPIPWTDDNSVARRLGKVDFENDESTTMLTLEAYPSGTDDATVVHLVDFFGRVTIHHNGRDLLIIDEDGEVSLP